MGSQDNKLIKKAHQRQPYTEDQLEDLAKCLDPDTGYEHFATNFFHIQHPVKGKMLFEPYPFQLNLLRTFHQNRYSCCLLSRQMGKALANTTPILTPTGFIPMGDLSVGDKIYGPDGNTTTIKFITETMLDRTCFELEFGNGEKIIADAEHLWTWQDVDKGEITGTTSELIESMKGREERVYIDYTKVVKFDTQPVTVDPYQVGWWYGRNAKDILESNGVDSQVIPTRYVFNDEHVRIELLQGLMDSIGEVSPDGFYEVTSPRKSLIDRIRLILSTLGVKSSLIWNTHGNISYTVKFKVNRFDVFKLPQNIEKQDSVICDYSYNRINILNIKEVSSVPVRCLQVDNHDHLFLAGSTLIPTHNTTCAASYLLWYAMFNQDQTILIAAHKYSGAQEIMQRIRYAYEDCPDHIRCGVVNYNKGSIEFENGSRIVSATTTSNTGRGMSISLLYLDEFAFTPATIAEEFWTSISPTLSTGGRAIITSTPNSDEDTFATIWKEANRKFDEYGNEQPVGVNGFAPFKALWYEHPDRDEAWKKREMGKIGVEKFNREFECLGGSTIVQVKLDSGLETEVTLSALYDMMSE